MQLVGFANTRISTDYAQKSSPDTKWYQNTASHNTFILHIALPLMCLLNAVAQEKISMVLID